jgi:hypothetical protein
VVELWLRQELKMILECDAFFYAGGDARYSPQLEPIDVIYNQASERMSPVLLCSSDLPHR